MYRSPPSGVMDMSAFRLSIISSEASYSRTASSFLWSREREPASSARVTHNVQSGVVGHHPRLRRVLSLFRQSKCVLERLGGCVIGVERSINNPLHELGVVTRLRRPSPHSECLELPGPHQRVVQLEVVGVVPGQ